MTLQDLFFVCSLEHLLSDCNIFKNEEMKMKFLPQLNPALTISHDK